MQDRHFNEATNMNQTKSPRNRTLARFGAWALAGMAALTLLGCDAQRMSELQVGTSSEAEVRLKFGEPEAVWPGANGERIYEYNRQPNGKVNYQMTIGTDGRLLQMDQVLNARNFSRVVPGMRMEDVRRLLGKPATITPYQLKREVTYEWRYLDQPNQEMVFSVDFDDAQLTVKRAASLPDPNTADARAGR